MQKTKRSTNKRIVLEERHLRILEAYGRRHNIIATVGIRAGEVDHSRVIKLAIEKLPWIDKIQDSNGGN